jgi:hypothetical protein
VLYSRRELLDTKTKEAASRTLLERTDGFRPNRSRSGQNFRLILLLLYLVRSFIKYRNIRCLLAICFSESPRDEMACVDPRI